MPSLPCIDISIRKGAGTLFACLLIGALAACTSTTKPGAVDVDRRQLLIVPSETIEQMAAISFREQNDKARAAGKLITEGTDFERLRRIAARLQARAPVFRNDAARWNWEIALIDAPTLNASCAPGGKITVYTGLIRQLALSDDEIAMVVGHEVAHAVREHGRERVSQALAQNVIASLALGAVQTGETQRKLAAQVADVLYNLPNSRKNEIEADRIGLEMAARAGFNPQAAVSVWQKMSQAGGAGGPPEFLSTHPANASRIEDLQRLIPTVQPLYEAAPKS
ncbi:MAG: M48 family metallopeptidase [Pseudomonadota bacterium]